MTSATLKNVLGTSLNCFRGADIENTPTDLHRLTPGENVLVWKKSLVLCDYQQHGSEL